MRDLAVCLAGTAATVTQHCPWLTDSSNVRVQVLRRSFCLRTINTRYYLYFQPSTFRHMFTTVEPRWSAWRTRCDLAARREWRQRFYCHLHYLIIIKTTRKRGAALAVAGESMMRKAPTILISDDLHCFRTSRVYRLSLQ